MTPEEIAQDRIRWIRRAVIAIPVAVVGWGLAFALAVAGVWNK
jgi:hypothetical protein